jgi:hypothetical protein
MFMHFSKYQIFKLLNPISHTYLTLPNIHSSNPISPYDPNFSLLTYLINPLPPLTTHYHPLQPLTYLLPLLTFPYLPLPSVFSYVDHFCYMQIAYLFSALKELNRLSIYFQFLTGNKINFF